LYGSFALNTKVSFWLIPSEEDKAFFQQIIDSLSQEYDAPTFTPHVTIYSGEYAPDESLAELLEKATQDVQPFSLKVDQLFYTEEFTKTLFVQLDQSPILSHLSDSLRRNSKQPSEYALNPHLSLIYQYLSESIKKSLSTKIYLPKSELLFDEVRAISTPNKVKGVEDVKNWEVICIRKLQSL
jgi:2'-5' RNA ligase